MYAHMVTVSLFPTHPVKRRQERYPSFRTDGNLSEPPVVCSH
jgi:hypothetical protein